MGNASDWSCHVGNLIQPIRSTTQIWVVVHHQYGISALVSQMSFGRETSGSVTKCRLFSHWLNNCLLMHCHKSIMNTLETVNIACANERCKGNF